MIIVSAFSQWILQKFDNRFNIFCFFLNIAKVPFRRVRRHFWRHVKASSGLRHMWLLPVNEAQSAVTIWKARGRIAGEERQNRSWRNKREKMTSFSNKFGAYTMTQLNEILEDDEKLTKMVHEMDEVCLPAAFCRPMLASCWLLFPVRFLSLNPLLCRPPPPQQTHGTRTEKSASING